MTDTKACVERLPAERRKLLRRSSPRSVLAAVAWISVGFLLGAAGIWSVQQVFATQTVAPAEVPFATAEVVEGEVGSSITLNTVASWSMETVAVNAASGTLTDLDIAAGDNVSVGQRLYSVNLRPTVVGQGTIPSFSEVSVGSTGRHVAQLQAFLAGQGHWQGQVSERFTPAFEQAVRAWQAAAGFPVDGVVQPGDIVWVETLPARLALEPEVFVKGQLVSAGVGDIRALGSSPSFQIPMQPTQLRFAPPGTAVEVLAPDGARWEATAGEQQLDPANSDLVTVPLIAPDGGAVCGDGCGMIAADAASSLVSEIVTVPTQQGLVVPSSAIVSDASGQTYVVDEVGNRHNVTLVQSARGLSLIEQVDAGLVVRVPSPDGS